MVDYEAKKHITESLDKGVRYDSRKKDQFREIEIKMGVISGAEGSAYVKLGNTEIIAGVKMSVDKPFPDTPEHGVLIVGAELLPMSNPKFESGPPDAYSIEVARIIDKGIRESHCIDTKKLCIKKGEKVWCVNVDLAPINADGNLIDAGSIAAIAAIMNTKYPVYENDKVDYKRKTDESLPLSKVPIAITVFKFGDNLIVDPTEQEEAVMDARLTIITMEDGKICALQKGGSGTLTVELISEMVDLSLSKGIEIRKLLK